MFTLQNAKNAINNNPEFKVRNNPAGFTNIFYVLQSENTFGGLRSNLRGTTFDTQSGKIISLPLHKFFNVGQCANTQWELLCNKRAKVYEKLDGSMIHVFMFDDKLWFATKGGVDSDQAKYAMKIAERNNELVDAITKDIYDGFTPIFELVGPSNKIVVRYKYDELRYLISRNRVDGSYRKSVSFDGILGKAKEMQLTLAEAYNGIDNLENAEGYVCVMEDGMWVKMKSKWYLERHRMFDIWNGPRWKLYGLALDNKLDEIFQVSDDDQKQELKIIEENVVQDYEGLYQNIVSIGSSIIRKNFPNGIDLLCKEQRKTFALCAKKYKEHFSLLMLFYVNDEDKFDGAIRKCLLEQYRERALSKIN